MDNNRYTKWKRSRQSLLCFLSRKAERVRSMHRLTSIGRLLGSNMDMCFTIAGFLLDKFKREVWADGAFTLAFLSGMVCLSVSLMEILYTHSVDDELIQAIHEDERNFKRLQNARKVFVDITLEREYHDLVNELQPLDVFGTDQESVFNMTLQEIWKPAELYGRLLKLLRESSKHPVFLDFARVQLQVFSKPKNSIGIFSLSVRDLPEEQQRIASVPVSGRMVLNSLTSFKSYCNLRGEFVPHQYKVLLCLEDVLKSQSIRIYSLV